MGGCWSVGPKKPALSDTRSTWLNRTQQPSCATASLVRYVILDFNRSHRLSFQYGHTCFLSTQTSRGKAFSKGFIWCKHLNGFVYFCHVEVGILYERECETLGDRDCQMRRLRCFHKAVRFLMHEWKNADLIWSSFHDAIVLLFGNCAEPDFLFSEINAACLLALRF